MIFGGSARHDHTIILNLIVYGDDYCVSPVSGYGRTWYLSIDGLNHAWYAIW